MLLLSIGTIELWGDRIRDICGIKTVGEVYKL